MKTKKLENLIIELINHTGRLSDSKMKEISEALGISIEELKTRCREQQIEKTGSPQQIRKLKIEKIEKKQ